MTKPSGQENGGVGVLEWLQGLDHKFGHHNGHGSCIIWGKTGCRTKVDRKAQHFTLAEPQLGPSLPLEVCVPGEVA